LRMTTRPLRSPWAAASSSLILLHDADPSSMRTISIALSQAPDACRNAQIRHSATSARCRSSDASVMSAASNYSSSRQRPGHDRRVRPLFHAIGQSPFPNRYGGRGRSNLVQLSGIFRWLSASCTGEAVALIGKAGSTRARTLRFSPPRYSTDLRTRLMAHWIRKAVPAGGLRRTAWIQINPPCASVPPAEGLRWPMPLGSLLHVVSCAPCPGGRTSLDVVRHRRAWPPRIARRACVHRKSDAMIPKHSLVRVPARYNLPAPFEVMYARVDRR